MRSGPPTRGLRKDMRASHGLFESDACGDLLLDDAGGKVESLDEAGALAADVIDGQAGHERGDVAERADAALDVVQLVLPSFDPVVEDDVREGDGSVEERAGEGGWSAGVEG